MRKTTLPLAMDAELAERNGVTRSRVRNEIAHGRWKRFGPTVVITDPTADREMAAAAAGLVLAGPTAALSGSTALRVLRLTDLRPPHTHCLVLRRGGKFRRVGPVAIRPTKRPYIVHRTCFDDPHLPVVPIVHPARAAADACLGATFLPPVMALTAAVLQRRLATYDELVAELRAGPRNGSSMLRRAVAEIGGAESVAETDLARSLISARCPEFEQNVTIIDGRTGRILGRVDVLWRGLRAGLELDSERFHFSATDWNATLERHTAMTVRGLSLTHCSPRSLRTDCPRVMAELTEWLAGRATELGVDLPPPALRLRARLRATPEPLVL